MAITRYCQNVAVEQIPFANYPGGGPIPGPAGNQGFNDPGLELGNVMEVTCIYQMYGNEANSDVVNLYMAQPNSIVKPTGTICQSGIATTAVVSIGDDDTTGYGLVSSGAAFEGPQLSFTPLGANIARYASGVNIATGQTNPIAFAGGTALTDPYIIGTTATEQSATGGGGTGSGVSGSWVQMTFTSIGTPVAGKVIVVRLTVIKT